MRATKTCVLAALALLLTGRSAAESPNRVLFDGISLTGWTWSVAKDAPQPAWRAKAGELCTTPGEGVPVYLLTEDSFSDFDLSFEWKTEKAGNSGIKYRFQGYWVSRELRPEPGGPDRIEPVALEYQISDDEANPDALSDSKHSAGALYEYWAPGKTKAAKAGIWHTGRIVARGLSIEHWMDGVKVVDLKLDSPEAQSAFKQSRRKGSSPVLARHERRSSPIALQFHDGVVCFRNLRIKPL